MSHAIRLHKDGRVSGPVYPPDVAAWLAVGWALTPQPPQTNDQIQPKIQRPQSSSTSQGDAAKPADSIDRVFTPDAETVANPRQIREAELWSIYQPNGPDDRKDWRSIAAIAKKHGITEKPEGGWDDAIALILAAEFPTL